MTEPLTNEDLGPPLFQDKFLNFLEKGREVGRYHTHDVIKRQSVGAHSFGVAMICWALEERAPSANLLVHALAHDLAEHATGDIPSPVKKRNPALRVSLDALESELYQFYDIDLPPLLPHEVLQLKRADLIDGMLYCLSERRLGNRKLDYVFRNFVRYYDTLPGHPRGEAMVAAIQKAFRDETTT